MNVFSLGDNRVDVWLELAAASDLCLKIMRYSSCITVVRFGSVVKKYLKLIKCQLAERGSTKYQRLYKYVFLNK